MTEPNRCLWCQKRIAKFFKKTHERKFCSPLCNATYHGKKHWEENKNNKVFRKENSERTKQWVIENRERFNDLMREPNKIRARLLRAERTEKGLCRKCGKVRVFDYKSCDDCRKKIKKYPSTMSKLKSNNVQQN